MFTLYYFFPRQNFKNISALYLTYDVTFEERLKQKQKKTNKIIDLLGKLWTLYQLY